jgi:hypothetical protein
VRAAIFYQPHPEKAVVDLKSVAVAVKLKK